MYFYYIWEKKTINKKIKICLYHRQLLIADPTDDEESLSLGKLTIVSDEEAICCIHKPGMLYIKIFNYKYIKSQLEYLIYFNQWYNNFFLGGIPVSQDLFMKSLAKSKRRADLVRTLINTAISTIEEKFDSLDKNTILNK